MSHLEEGALLALRDREGDPGGRRHVQGCATCAAALDEMRERATSIEAALSALDFPVDVRAAKSAVRARLDAGPWKARRPWGGRWSRDLRRAAAVLVVVAGAASALPNSPVRRWLRGSAEHAAPEGDVTPIAASAPQRAGIAVPVAAGGITVSITGGAGSRIEVVWVDDGSARVAASAGSSFSYGNGRIEAAVTAGPVRVELPRSADPVTLVVDGRTYLARSGGTLRVDAPVEERTDDRLLFSVPQ